MYIIIKCKAIYTIDLRHICSRGSIHVVMASKYAVITSFKCENMLE